MKVLGQKLGFIKLSNFLYFIENKENYESTIIFLNLVCPIHTRKKILAPVVSVREYGLGHLKKQHLKKIHIIG